MFYTLSWYTAGPVLRLLFRTTYEGQRHIPRRGPAILASNHLSFLDHLIVALGTRRQVFFISKNQHFQKPIRRMLFTKWGVIPLRRGEGDQDAFNRSIEIIRDGNLFCIYPEGTRSLDGKLHKGHTGVARLAAITGAPVIPVAMTGTFEAFPKGAKRPRFLPCGAKYGKAIDLSHLRGKEGDRDAMRKATNEIMQAIQRLGGQEYVDAYQYNPEVKTHGSKHG